MEVRAIVGDISEIQADVLVLGLFEGAKQLDGPGLAVDKAMGGALQGMLVRGELSGRCGETSLIHTLGKLPAAKVCVVGLGKKEEMAPDKVRRATAEACRVARATKAMTAASVVLGAGQAGINHEIAAQAITEGASLGLYRFNKYLTKDAANDITELMLVECEEIHASAVEKGIRLGRITAEASALARDIVNEPANVMTPTELAAIAMALARTHGFECKVFEREQMAAMGMGALLAVAQGSDQPPKLIVLKYRGNPESLKTMGWVGKGITFDSGGISLKPPENMGDMKDDKAGAAAVIAAVTALASLKAKVNVTAIAPVTENLPSGKAYRPGDVLRAMNGKTIEVISTDAEGRLILADALSYAVKEELSPIVDIATLTGACHVALGDVCSGLFGNDQEWLNQVRGAGEQAGEHLWPMPCYDDYKEQLKSGVADMKNSGARWGGAITGALFLAEFAGTGPWVHIDIAGTALLDKERGYLVKGATGVGVRTLINLGLGLAAKKPQGGGSVEK